MCQLAQKYVLLRKAFFYANVNKDVATSTWKSKRLIIAIELFSSREFLNY